MACPIEGRDELPGDLWDVLDDASRRGASYVLFNRDAIPLNDLSIRHPAFGDRTDEVNTIGEVDRFTNGGAHATP